MAEVRRETKETEKEQPAMHKESREVCRFIDMSKKEWFGEMNSSDGRAEWDESRAEKSTLGELERTEGVRLNENTGWGYWLKWKETTTLRSFVGIWSSSSISTNGQTVTTQYLFISHTRLEYWIIIKCFIADWAIECTCWFVLRENKQWKK